MKYKKVIFQDLTPCFLLTGLVLLLFSGCAVNSKECRGYPFSKQFPADVDSVGVTYDRKLKMLYDVDGLVFTYNIKGWKYTKERPLERKGYYNEFSIEQSPREKRYIAAYKMMEAEFDRKYAGKIKDRIRAVLVKYPVIRFSEHINGKDVSYAPELTKKYSESVNYPSYMVGDTLPEGLVTPSSYFSDVFIGSYIMGKGDFKRFIMKNYGRRALGFTNWSSYQALIRMSTVFSEYVLTWYYLQEYDTPEERHQAALDLATYYSNVAFRGAAEIMHGTQYYYDQRISDSEECEIANYIAKQVFELILTIDDPARMAKIKELYHEDIVEKCHHRLASIQMYPYDKLWPNNSRENRRKWLAKWEEILQELAENKAECVND